MSGDQTVLAVAGDNSKTDVAVIQADGALLAAVRGPGASPDRLGLEPALERLGETVDRAWSTSGLPAGNRRAAVGVYFMAGVDSSDDEAKVAQGVGRRRWSLSSLVANDVFASLWAANGRGDGVAVFVGAGINCVGRASIGTTARFAALGSLSGDWGDGESLGVAALAAAVRGEDGRAAPTRLTRSVCECLGRATAQEVACAVHRGEIATSRLLDLVPLVMYAAAIQDRVAEALLDRQADEVVRFVAAAARRLNLGKGRFRCGALRVDGGQRPSSDRGPGSRPHADRPPAGAGGRLHRATRGRGRPGRADHGLRRSARR